MSRSATRKPSNPSFNEDAGSGALPSAGEEGQEEEETKSGLRRKGTSGTIPEGSDAHSAFEEDQKEEEDESPVEGRRKRTTSASLEAELPKRGKIPCQEESPAAADSGLAWDPRAQPLVNS